MSGMIQTDSLTKHYGKVHSVDTVSLTVNKGEIYGFLGLNGAGKTTTIRMLLGMVRPTSGAAYLYGKKVDAGNYRLWNSIGYLVETPYSYPEMTVYENLEIIRSLRFEKNAAKTDDVIEKLHLTEYRNRKVKNLSLGNAQRLGLAKALIHQPEILILDEPTNGLDPAGIVEIRELLSDMAFNKSVTVFISSHILGEIAKLTTRIGIIHNGALMQEFETAELRRRCEKKLLVNSKDLAAATKKLKQEGYAVSVSKDGIMEMREEKAINNPDTIAALLVHAGLPLTLLKVEEEALESYFLRTINMNGGAPQ
jgi:ABC-2 type transport system ATP-binding protein